MNWILAKMKWIMLISGLLTTTMLYAAVDPQASLLSTFGETMEGDAADVVVRNWGALIALIGAMLIYGAFHPQNRPLIVVVAGISKAVFITLVLSHGNQFLGHQAGVAVVVDAFMILLFIAYLVGTQQKEPGGRRSRN